MIPRSFHQILKPGFPRSRLVRFLIECRKRILSYSCEGKTGSEGLSSAQGNSKGGPVRLVGLALRRERILRLLAERDIGDDAVSNPRAKNHIGQCQRA